MDRMRTIAPALAVALIALAAPAAASHISIDVGGDGIRIDRDVVELTADDGDTIARVAIDGRLFVDGRRVNLTERDRQALVLYNRSVRRIERKAIEIGIQGAGLAAHAVSAAIVAIATGDGHRVERRVEAHAEDIKDAARELCEEVRQAETLQDAVADRVAAFRPFARIHLDEDDCRVDDDDDHGGGARY
jgi:hypothetical protein